MIIPPPPPPPPPPLPPKPHPQTPKPKLPSRSNKQVLCPGPNRSDGGNCNITAHPTVKGGRYCATHQEICLLCPGNPRHLITERCRSCVGRERALERAAAVTARAAAVMARAAAVVARAAGTVRVTATAQRRAGTGGTGTAAPRARNRRGMNRRCGGMKRKR